MAKKSTPKSKRSAARRSLRDVVREPIMSGDGSRTLWNDIIDAKNVDQLRIAVYHLACKCQELESEIRRLSNATEMSHSAPAIGTFANTTKKEKEYGSKKDE